MTGQLTIDVNALGPFRAGQPSTARLAALDNYFKSGSQREAVFVALAAAGERGLNSYEAAVAARIPRMHTAHTRLSELAEQGLVVLTDEKRPTDTQSLACVWQLTDAGRRAAAALRGES